MINLKLVRLLEILFTLSIDLKVESVQSFLLIIPLMHKQPHASKDLVLYPIKIIFREFIGKEELENKLYSLI